MRMPKITFKQAMIMTISAQLLFLLWGPAHTLLATYIGSPATFTATVSDPYDPIRGNRLVFTTHASTLNVPSTQKIFARTNRLCHSDHI